MDEANCYKTKFRGAKLNLARILGANFRLADLSEADFTEANMSNSSFFQATLRDANLTRAVMRDSNLSWADLTNAKLSQVNFISAIFEGAKIGDANFDETSFAFADLSNTDFSSADFSGAYIGRTKFCNNDLSKVKGLDKALHRGPSTIGIDTLYKSDGKIPESFLRGAGVTDDFITFVPSLVGQAIEFYSCFISYSHEDEDFARRLHSRMRSENLRVWFAPEDMKGGRKLHEEIFRAIQIHEKLLLVLSENSMKSDWVATEIRRAKKVEREEDRRKLFPIRLVDFGTIQNWECFDADSGKDLAAEVREYYIPDFSNWKDHNSFEREFAKLLQALRATEK